MYIPFDYIVDIMSERIDWFFLEDGCSVDFYADGNYLCGEAGDSIYIIFCWVRGRIVDIWALMDWAWWIWSFMDAGYIARFGRDDLFRSEYWDNDLRDVFWDDDDRVIYFCSSWYMAESFRFL